MMENGAAVKKLSVLALLLALSAMAAIPASAQQVEYYHLDALGSVRAVTDAAGAILVRHDYQPYGREWNAPASTDTRRFTGKERDSESGLDYFGARYYSAPVARFTSVDPVYTWSENLADPQRWNRYSYTRGNPLRYVDPDGRQSQDVERAAQGAATVSGATLAHDAAVRSAYARTVQPLSPTDSAARTAAKIAARNASSPVGSALAEAMRPMAGEAGRTAGTASRTNIGVNRAMGAAGVAGKGLAAVAVGIAVVNVATAPEGETGRVASQEVGALAGSISFGIAGGKGGALIGTALAGPPGGVVGAVVGTLAGGIGGAFAGAKAGNNIYDASQNQ